MTRAALNLYRRILRASRRFGPDEGRTIRDEARSLFEKNAALTDAQEIDAKLFEGNTRVDLALHYGIASPRLYNVTRGTMPSSRKHHQGMRPQPVPAYMDSYYDADTSPNPR
ncbi:Complex 1 LYR protein domain-containing protein [Plasmodiophora brassicae]|uniref:Complex 1 LYR protein domain-containing protein n=1 Tax=Plasmodiophora brassicae TaxID=37360 RepID=A0A3P3YPC2_PLABS|nr:unnamed protein product [Plasmodiophora brassicae]